MAILTAKKRAYPFWPVLLLYTLMPFLSRCTPLNIHSTFRKLLVFALLLCGVYSPSVSYGDEDRESLVLKLVGETLTRTEEIQKLTNYKSSFGDNVTVTAYGSTSRELIQFIEDKSLELGSLDNVKAWLEIPNRSISLVEWHNPISDLDFLVFDDSGYEAIRSEIGRLRGSIVGDGIFFQGADVNVAEDFFDSLHPSEYHFFPLANIAISSDGKLVEYEELATTIDGKAINLSRWGYESFLRKEIPVAYNDREKISPILLLDSYFRILRLISEHPDFSLSQDSAHSIKKMAERLASDPYIIEIKKYLSWLQAPPSSMSAQEDIVFKNLDKSFRKIFSSSSNAKHTAWIISQMGLLNLFKGAGVSPDKLPVPLPEKPLTGHSPLQTKKIVYIETPLSEIIGFQSGGVWADNIFQSTTRPYLEARATYHAPSFGSLIIPVEILAEAVEGIDFVKQGNSIYIYNTQALKKNALGHISTTKLTDRFILEELSTGLTSLKKEDLHSELVQSLVLAVRNYCLHNVANNEQLLVQLTSRLLALGYSRIDFEFMSIFEHPRIMKMLSPKTHAELNKLLGQVLLNVGTEVFNVSKSAIETPKVLDIQRDASYLANQNTLVFFVRALERLRTLHFLDESRIVENISLLEKRLIELGVLRQPDLIKHYAQSVGGKSCVEELSI